MGQSVGFSNERAYADHVAELLEAEGFSVVREVAVRGRHRLDILAEKDGIKKGIEIKLEGRGLLDDISKAERLLRLPEVDEMYACAPSAFMSDDVRAFAANLGIGLLAADPGQLVWLASSKQLQPARFTLGGGYASQVDPGAEVTYQANVLNFGAKTAVDVEVFLTPAGPFALPRQKSRSKAECKFLEPGQGWQSLLICKVRKDARPGRYSLMVTVRAANAQRVDQTSSFEVRELGR